MYFILKTEFSFIKLLQQFWVWPLARLLCVDKWWFWIEGGPISIKLQNVSTQTSLTLMINLGHFGHWFSFHTFDHFWRFWPSLTNLTIFDDFDHFSPFWTFWNQFTVNWCYVLPVLFIPRLKRKPKNRKKGFVH